MIKRRLSLALAAVHAVLGLVPLLWAVQMAIKPVHANDAAMAWGVAIGMFVAPLWALFLIAAVIVDLRAPRTSAALLASLAFPVGFVLSLFVLR